jgi:hypothetical protein
MTFLDNINKVVAPINAFIKSAVDSIEYKESDPKSFIVLVPLVSYVVQDICFRSIRETLYLKPKKTLEASAPFQKSQRAAKWHAVGALIHTLAMALLLKSSPLLLISFTCMGLMQILNAIDAMIPKQKTSISNGSTV